MPLKTDEKLAHDLNIQSTDSIASAKQKIEHKMPGFKVPDAFAKNLKKQLDDPLFEKKMRMKLPPHMQAKFRRLDRPETEEELYRFRFRDGMDVFYDPKNGSIHGPATEEGLERMFALAKAMGMTQGYLLGADEKTLNMAREMAKKYGLNLLNGVPESEIKPYPDAMPARSNSNFSPPVPGQAPVPTR